VADMIGQCGSKSDSSWPGEREKVTTTQKILQVPAEFWQSSGKVPTGSCKFLQVPQVPQVPTSSDPARLFFKRGVKFFLKRVNPKSSDSSDRFRQNSDRTVQTLNACLQWAAGVLEVVANMIGQCGSKSTRSKADLVPPGIAALAPDGGPSHLQIGRALARRLGLGPLLSVPPRGATGPGPCSRNWSENSPQPVTACRGGPRQWPVTAARSTCRLALAPRLGLGPGSVRGVAGLS
jgi:hypothetical protein